MPTWQVLPPGEAVLSCAAPVDVDTPGSIGSAEFCMTTNRITITLAIDGMSGHCVTAVTKVLVDGSRGCWVQSVALGSAVIEAADRIGGEPGDGRARRGGAFGNRTWRCCGHQARRPAWGGAGCCSGAKNVMQRGRSADAPVVAVGE